MQWVVKLYISSLVPSDILLMRAQLKTKPTQNQKEKSLIVSFYYSFGKKSKVNMNKEIMKK